MESEPTVPPTHTVVLGVADPMAAAHLRRQLVLHPRFQLVATADNAIQTLYAVEAKKPSVVVMADDSPGLRGREVLADIASASPDTYVIITTPGDPRVLAGAPAVARAVPAHDLSAINEALDQLALFLDHPATGRHDRRSHDRREHQDWTKVFAERREQSRRDEQPAGGA